MESKRVLITGRHGFTGRYVAQELAEAGWDVWGLSNSKSTARTLITDTTQDRIADLTNPFALSTALDEIRPNAVVHLAAKAFVAHGSAEDFYRVNLLGTRNLLRALSDGGHAQAGVVLASSANVYGNTRVSPIPETTTPAPANDYAVSKLAMEYASHLFADRLPIVVTRPFNYTGRGQNALFLVPKIVAHFRDRAPEIELGNLDVARDFSDVRDVSHVYRTLLEADAWGKTVNVCSGNATELGEIIAICEDITGHGIKVAVNPALVRVNEVQILNGDPARLTKLIGPLRRRSLVETLRWMLE